jgi:hypothetical protein
MKEIERRAMEDTVDLATDFSTINRLTGRVQPSRETSIG